MLQRRDRDHLPCAGILPPVRKEFKSGTGLPVHTVRYVWSRGELNPGAGDLYEYRAAGERLTRLATVWSPLPPLSTRACPLLSG